MYVSEARSACPSFLPHQIAASDSESFVGLFTKFMKFEVAEGLYPALTAGRPCDLQSTLTHIGNSALVVQTRVRQVGSTSVLATIPQCAIAVNLVTRRPQPIPGVIRRKASKLPKPHPFPLEFKLPTNVPIFSRSYTIDESFLDMYGHVNVFTYYMLILTCVEYAIIDGFLVNGKCHVKEFASVHNGEAMIGDTLAFDLWKIDENKIHVLLSKSGEGIVLTSLMFHDAKSYQPKVAASL